MFPVVGSVWFSVCLCVFIFVIAGLLGQSNVAERLDFYSFFMLFFLMCVCVFVDDDVMFFLVGGLGCVCVLLVVDFEGVALFVCFQGHSIVFSDVFTVLPLFFY